ncbi:hypothetical protein [Aquimarina sp. 2201CG5-10]|uniref:hypothetical protein n=1 Tax=Aquimarina callyspongiae TaxID=3098150 RepID=UPI002AB3FE9C|nr:hypothetical protein [Aquimarina sp. 2201CG5-10]MDY8138908.1 hypothetical protein [Aquimarina sp. 2201CG5-10]
MKTIKTIFAILFVSSMFIACETDSVNDEVGFEVEDTIATEDEVEEVTPPGGN